MLMKKIVGVHGVQGELFKDAETNEVYLDLFRWIPLKCRRGHVNQTLIHKYDYDHNHLLFCVQCNGVGLDHNWK